YSDEWHVAHFVDPKAVVPESIMPQYAFLLDQPADVRRLKNHMQALRTAGVPYTDDMIKNAKADALAQAAATPDASGLTQRYGPKVLVRDFDTGAGALGHVNGMVTEMDALIAYMQRLGTLVDFSTYNPDVATKPDTANPNTKVAP
ncbi:MAG: hypothetical protein EBZ69_03660, partial [Alphaproteobacteria bacterium]|nr:hypothetical protein [Alphaproteobacteria bacterium]